MINDKQLKYLQSSGLKPAQITQVINAAGGYDQSTKPKTLGGFAGNVVKSGANAVGGMVSAAANVFNPNMEKNTVANVGRLGLGAAQLLIPGEQGQEETARNVGRFYKDRYGSLEKIGNTLYNDPVGVALDASTVLGGAGLGAKALGMGKTASTLSRASRVADPFAMAASGAGKVTSNVFRKLPGKLDDASNTLLTKGIGQPKQLGKIEGMAGRPTGQLMTDYNIFDRSPDTVQTAIDTARGNYDDSIRASGASIGTGDFLKRLDDQIQELSGQATLSDTARVELEALIQRRNNIEQYLSSNGAVPLQFSPNTAVEMKSQIYKDVNPSTFNPQYQGSGGQLAAKRAYQGLISSIDEAAPGTKQLGRDQAALIKLKELAGAAEKRGDARQLFNFTKMGGAGLGGVVSGLPGAIGGMLAEQVVNSPQFLKAASKGSRALSNAMSSPKVAKVGNVFKKGGSNIYNSAKAADFLSPDLGTSTSTSKQTRRKIQPKIETLKPILPGNQRMSTKKAKKVNYKPAALSSGTHAFSKVGTVKRGSFY